MGKLYTLLTPLGSTLPRRLWSPIWIPLVAFGIVWVVLRVVEARVGPTDWLSPPMLVAHSLFAALLVSLFADRWIAGRALGALDQGWVRSVIDDRGLVENPYYLTHIFSRGLEGLSGESPIRWILPVLLAVPISVIGVSQYVSAVRAPNAASSPPHWILIACLVEFLLVACLAMVSSLLFRGAVLGVQERVAGHIQSLYDTGILAQLAVAEAVTAEEVKDSDEWHAASQNDQAIAAARSLNHDPFGGASNDDSGGDPVGGDPFASASDPFQGTERDKSDGAKPRFSDDPFAPQAARGSASPNSESHSEYSPF